MIVERLNAFIEANENRITLNLGGVEIRKKIGQGLNGIVYEAKIFNTPIAVKFLVTEKVGDEKKLKSMRFLAEYFNVISLDDLTNIVKYIDYDLLKFYDQYGEMEIPTILMKLYDSNLVKYREEISEINFLKLFGFLLDVVEKIHLVGIIHRDIRPSNILIAHNQFALSDFGIASYNPDQFKFTLAPVKKEFNVNRIFSAPEEENPMIPSHPTMDIYTVGQVLQWYVFGDSNRINVSQRISKVFSELDIYDEIIEKCLKKNPQDRFQSIFEIRQFLK